MVESKLLANFKEIKIESPVDKIIKQTRKLITSGQLKAGDRLPPERKLAEKLGVGRSHVREALRKLEFYGILRTLPQSGTIVAGQGIAALEGLISDVLKVEDSDFASLVETRVLLDTTAASLAAQRRSSEDIIKMQQALEAYEGKMLQEGQAIEEDLMFHLKLVEASKNDVLKSLMLIITPDIISSFIQLDVCRDTRNRKVLDEHRIILQHIIDQKPEEASTAMRLHLKEVTEYSNNIDARRNHPRNL